jgi:hypothetical protein
VSTPKPRFATESILIDPGTVCARTPTYVTRLEILLGAGLAAGAVASSLVYLDWARRGMPQASRLVPALACGGGSFCGFLLPYVFSRELQYLYFQVLKPQPIAVSPREWLSVGLTAGLVIGIVLVSVYFAGSGVWGRRPA